MFPLYALFCQFNRKINIRNFVVTRKDLDSMF